MLDTAGVSISTIRNFFFITVPNAKKTCGGCNGGTLVNKWNKSNEK
jgi:hypothetical protein